MLKFYLNRNGLNKLCNRIFDHITQFFQGNTPNAEKVLSGDRSQLAPNSREWDLHQQVSDIVIRDITVSFGWLVPVSFQETLVRVQRNILIYFYADAIEEEENFSGETSNILSQDLSNRLKAKVIFLVGRPGQIINSRVISFYDWWKRLVKKLEILLCPEQEREYYLIGSFSPKYNDGPDCDKPPKIQFSHKIKLSLPLPFYKRN